jgi:nucleoside-diphosphate-sugar epimerase
MRCLVVGAEGFVGRNICKELEKNDNIEVIKGSRKATGDDENVARIDLLDQESIGDAIRRYHPETIINCAGIVDASMDVEQNIQFTNNILEQAIQVGGVKRVIISGSAGSYGYVSSEHIPVAETTPLNANQGYGHAKVREEQLALDYQKKHNIGVVVMRIFNPIGKDMADKFLLTRLLQQVDEYKSGNRDAIELARLDAKRDYIAVEDVASAFRAVVEGEPKESVYNIGSGVSTSNGELLELILKNSKLKERPPIRETSDVAEPLVAIQADTSRLSNEFGWHPVRKIDETVKEIIDDKSSR